MGAPKRGFLNKERFQTPTEHRAKSDELWQVRSYSWRFAIATRKVGWDPTVRNERAKSPETLACVTVSDPGSEPFG
jgi:hypothetical protein